MPAPPEARPDGVTPPRLLHSVAPEYPARALATGRTVRVELFVTVAEDGTVSEVEVAASGGSEFDTAAIAAVSSFRFEPARRGEVAVTSRIRVPLEFVPSAAPAPAEPVAKEAPEARTEVASPSGAAAAKAPPEELKVTVEGARKERARARSSLDFQVDRDVLTAAPHKEGSDVLRAAPGLYIGRGEGPAVAHNYMLLGFDADHGQDIEFRVGGLPINIPSHLHGQGYADLSFLIGDVVQTLSISEGVHDPRQGDFAVAGSIDLALGVAAADRGIRLRSSAGSFGTYRQLALFAPHHAAEETFGAVQAMQTDGFGENRAGRTSSGIFQQRFGEGDITYRAVGIVHTARSNIAGVLRQDDIDAGKVCFYCVYPYPTARAQNALSSRMLTGLFADRAREDGENGQLGVWLGYDNFRLQENFTGFVEQSRTLNRVSGRGDLIEQRNRTFSAGLVARHKSAPYEPFSALRGTLELGADSRVDSIEQAQNLLDASVRNQTWDRRVDAGVEALAMGLWGDLDFSYTQYLRVRLGARADALSYEIEDRLGNFAPLVRPQDTYIVGFRRSASGLAWGPRSSVELHPLPWLCFHTAYGEGYRSPQARLLEDGEPAPFSKVRSGDFGVKLDFDEALQLSGGLYSTTLSDDVAFDASEGRLERIGPTSRVGGVAHALTRPVPWLVGSASFTFVRATLREPPPASAAEPQPPFSKGQHLPFVPPVVVRADLGTKHALLESAGGSELSFHTGLGLSFLSSRPLPYGSFAEPVALLDASAGASFGAFELSLELFNALDRRYAAVEYSFPSDWAPEDGVRPRTPERHISAGAPLTWMLSLGVAL